MIGRSVRRREDERILRGRGRFLDDLEPPGTAHVAFVRSPHAHAAITAVGRPDLADGVLAVVTAADLDGIVRPLPLSAFGGAELADEPHPVLADGEVRYVGQPVAAVIARTRALAEDAAELVEVDYEPREAIVDPRSSDLALMRFSRRGGDVDGAFAAASHVTRLRCGLPRLAATPIEPRGALAVHDPGRDELTIWLSFQDVHRPRLQLAHILGRSEESLRVIVPDVGGAFGSKGVIAPEAAATAAAAILLAMPLKWTEDRFENLLAAYQGRGIVGDLELALDSDGRMLGLRAHLLADLGGYLLGATPIPPHTTAMHLTGCYTIEAAAVELLGARTHKVPTGPYRGAGRPDAAYMLERTVDQAARELGIDRFELRRRNLVRRFPHATPLGHVLDSGDYERCLDLALELGFGAGAGAPAPDTGRVRGTGVALYVERGGGEGEQAQAWLEPDGRFVVASSAGPHGQGQETAFAQIAAARLGVDLEQVELRFGDSASVPRGVGTFGGRSVAVAGSAVALACDRLLDGARALGAGLRDCPLAAVRTAPGGVEADGSLVGWAELATAAQRPELLPDGVEPGLRASATFGSEIVFSSGAHAAVVEIERATGRLTVSRLAAVDDAGTLINPLLVHGQVVGGAVQGLGECLTEEVVHDELGENHTVTLMDYVLLTAAEVPPIVTGTVSSPSPNNPLGAKAAGEGGTIGAVAAVANAVCDALGGVHLDPPYTPEKLWRALREAEA